jgi:polysaccharide biosynthesis transport protein
LPELESEPTLRETVQNALGLVRRQRWWILLPACVVTLATIAFVLRLPDSFTSEATLVFVQQQIPQRFVESMANTPAADAIQSMTLEILSSNRLLGIIDEVGLYAKEKQSLSPELLVGRMRRDVAIAPLNQTSGQNQGAFTITFAAESPRLARAVVSRLTSFFIEENVKTRGDQATQTTNFLTEQLDAAKKKLAEQEARLQDFKLHNLNELPEQQQVNMAALTGLQMQLQGTMAALSRAQQQRASLESMIMGNLALLQSERSTLLTRYTPRHADVMKKDQEIARTQALLERFKAGTGGSNNPADLAAPVDPVTTQLRSQIDANAAEIEGLVRDQERLRAEVAQYQDRLNFTPARGQQLSSILRDYELYSKDYTDLVSKQLQSRLSVSLEERQEGQQFRLLDPPSLPVRPSGPKRLKISLGGAGAALMLGLLLAFLMNSRDTSFHTDKALQDRFRFPLVLGVPVLATLREERARRRVRALEWFGGSVVTLVVLAAEFYVYRRG